MSTLIRQANKSLYFATRFGGARVYDITGDVTEGHKWEPWAACSDQLLRKRFTEDCIMF